MTYQLRFGGHPAKTENFDDAEACAKRFAELDDARLFVIDEQHGLWPGTPEQVAPVYRAMGVWK